MKKLVSLFLAVALVLSVVSIAAADDVISVVWPTWLSGENVGAQYWEPAVARFNEQYAGKYEIIIEESPQATHTDKMRQLYLQGKLPFIVEQQDQDWMRDVIIPEHGYYDLSGWIAENPDIAELFLGDMLAYNTTENGEVVAVPNTTVSVNAMYYNSELLGGFDGNLGDLTWDEFFDLMKTNNGLYPVNTGENALDSGLLLSAFLACEEGGPEMMRASVADKIYDYNNDIWINAFTKLQYVWQNFAAPNGVGAAYADIANTFMSKGAAVIGNGVWMIPEFVAESSDKWSNGFTGETVHASTYPTDIAFANNLSYGEFFIPATATEKEVEIALAFLSFIHSQDELEERLLVLGGNAPNLKPSQAYLDKLSENRLQGEFATKITSKTLIVPQIYNFMPNSICREEFPKMLPKLIDGSMSPAEFAAALTEKAQELLD